MKSVSRFWFSFVLMVVMCAALFGFSTYPHKNQVDQLSQNNHQVWPERYSATYGFELMADHNGVIIVASVDSTTQAYKLGVRPGMEILGWNTLPIKRKLESMKVRKYRDIFPGLTDEKIKLSLMSRGKPGDTAEVFFMTSTGNNRGLRLTATN